MSAARRTAGLIGAPTDVGAADRGASMGPEALRVAGLAAALRERGLEVQDLGNLNGPGNPWQPPHDGYRHLPEVVRWNELVHAAVHGELRQGRLPVLLGGDHCLSIGSISAVARHCREQSRKLRVLWLDAHADFNTSELSQSGNLHGMPLACLCGFGPPELTAVERADPGDRTVLRTSDRDPQRRPGREALRARAGPGRVRHALHRRDGDACHHGAGAGRSRP